MYQRSRFHFPLFLLILLVIGSPAVFAQTSVGLSLYGAFNRVTNGNGVTESPANSAGGLVELRHISSPIVGWEATYSYNRANQKYTPTSCTGTLVSCTPANVSADAHEITGDWVPSVHVGSFRPFGVLGLGVLVNQPVSGQSNTTSSNKMVYVYGAGLDWGLLPHLGLRFQYRGNLYKAPNVSKLYTSTNAFTHTAEPMIGAYFSF